MKVLVADQFSPAGMEELKSAGIDVVYDSGLNGDTLKEAMASHKPQVLVVRSTKVPKEIIDSNSDL